jgi:hypothetical protein
MKRNLILAITLGLAATAAVAEPTLDMGAPKDRVMFSVPETTSYQADTQDAGVRRLTEHDANQPFNP